MTSVSRPPAADEQLPPRVALVFAPLHKRAFGIAIGTAVGVTILAVTLVADLRNDAGRPGLGLLVNYFKGYSISPRGALIGGLWGFLVGFVGGWFVAFCRNLAIAASLFWIRTRAEMAQTRDFLDHI